VNRVRNRYLDQSVLSGHRDRPSDLKLFADLGLKSLRYPVLWETVSPVRPDERDFSWHDHRLNEIARLGMRPIVGLIHHGSGPKWTSLVDDQGFATGLAAHARATAERYPWVTDWTPVNEPLTTARFSALYGIWYPHARNEGAFWRALLNQIDATRFAMREIRRANPQARLVQTEDLGFCHATAPMAGQAEYENERRWITWDLLCGKVTVRHPLWERLCAWGLQDRLLAIADDPCPPDVIGLNHYLSSERLLDHRVELYPPTLEGGDGPAPYVNIEAVRTVAAGPVGIRTLLSQTWERYGRTIAITECHNGCTREEQMRWFDEVWRSAQAARTDGVEVEAVTAWALLGSVDWNRLLAEEAGHYESGIYDLQSGTPHPTAMVGFLKDLAAGRRPSAPILGGRGWWRRDNRFFDQVIDLPEPCPRRPQVEPREGAGSPLLIAGSGDARMAALIQACEHRHLAHRVVEIGACESSAAAERLDRLVEDMRPWAIVDVTNGPASPAIRAVVQERRLASGTWAAPGSQAPLPPHGGLVVVTGDLLGEHDLREFSRHVLQTLDQGDAFRAASNRLVPPIYLPDAANKLLDLLIDSHRGVYRLDAPDQMSWAELAAVIAHEAELDAFLVQPTVAPMIGRKERPASPSLPEAHDVVLPGLASAARRTVARWKLVTAGRNSCAVAGQGEGDALRHAAE
jgi:dTDP-4-dehydrorhamnose reductase